MDDINRSAEVPMPSAAIVARQFHTHLEVLDGNIGDVWGAVAILQEVADRLYGPAPKGVTETMDTKPDQAGDGYLGRMCSLNDRFAAANGAMQRQIERLREF